MASRFSRNTRVLSWTSDGDEDSRDRDQDVTSGITRASLWASVTGCPLHSASSLSISLNEPVTCLTGKGSIAQVVVGELGVQLWVAIFKYNDLRVEFLPVYTSIMVLY